MGLDNCRKGIEYQAGVTEFFLLLHTVENKHKKDKVVPVLK
jgi:hypothetical protein